MCGIAGIIYRDGGGERHVGRDMTAMLQAMKHRGPDSTGYALYRPAADGYVMHVKLAESTTVTTTSTSPSGIAASAATSRPACARSAPTSPTSRARPTTR